MGKAIKNIAKYFILAFLQVITLAAFGQNEIKIPPDFVETIPTNDFSEKWRILNSSENEFVVKIINGKLEVEQFHGVADCELKIPGGTLIGINRGEFGGELDFKPDNNSKDTLKIVPGARVNFLFNFRNKIYFMAGLCHMGFSNGALYQLEQTKDGFNYNKLVDFGDCPEAFSIDRDRFLVVTDKNFFIINGLKKEIVLSKAFWTGLYPNSIAVVDENNVFIGMRGGIAKLNLETKVLKFYESIK